MTLLLVLGLRKLYIMMYKFHCQKSHIGMCKSHHQNPSIEFDMMMANSHLNVKSCHSRPSRACKSFKTMRISSINSEKQPINIPLTDEEMKRGCKLGMDSHADTCCVNKHAYVESIVEGMVVDAIPFDGSLGKASNLPIVHAIYAIDNPLTFSTHLIRICNSIYIHHHGVFPCRHVILR